MRPHHLQAADRFVETVAHAGVRSLVPYAWGFAALSISAEGIENFTLQLERCLLILPDGTVIHAPENADVARRDFADALEAGGGALEVYLGVPALQTVRPNLAPVGGTTRRGTNAFAPRFAAVPVERYDENTGENPQQIEVRRYQGVILFGDEDHTGYQVVRVGRIERAPNATAHLTEQDAPPILGTQAWPALHQRLINTHHDVEARCKSLAAAAVDRQMTFSTGSPADVEHLLKVHVLNEALTGFGALLQPPLVHPFAAYQLSCRVIGQLSVFEETRRPRELPDYDHDRVGPILFELTTRIKALLDRIQPTDYLRIDFVPFARGLMVDLEHEWIVERREMYVGIECAMELDELQRHLDSIEFKVAAPKDVPFLKERRLPGLDVQRTRVPPGALPQRAGLYYFRIARDAVFWPKVEAERAVAIGVLPKDLGPLKMALYVVMDRR